MSIEGPTRHTLCRSVCLVYVARRYPLVSGDRAWFIETRQTAVRAASCGSCSVRLLPRCGADNISTREVVALPARETDRGRLLFLHKISCVVHVQCEVYNRRHRARCNRYVWCSRDELPMLLAICGCVAPNSQRGKAIRLMVYSGREIGSGEKVRLRAEQAIEK